jgi:hypothetical protein
MKHKQPKLAESDDEEITSLSTQEPLSEKLEAIAIEVLALWRDSTKRVLMDQHLDSLSRQQQSLVIRRVQRLSQEKNVKLQSPTETTPKKKGKRINGK